MLRRAQEILTFCRTTPYRILGWGVFGLLQADAYTSNWPSRSDKGILDIGSHQGNVSNSLLVGLVVGNITMRMVEDFDIPTTARQRGITTASALVVGAALNAIVEYRVGQGIIGHEFFDIFGPATTPDPLDVMYGALSSAASSMAIVAVADTETEPSY